MDFNVGLGIDVGGTNTDAVLIDLLSKEILSFAKALTTQDDLARGIEDALKKLDASYYPRISLIGLSTTLATNSIVEGVKRRVCGILIGYESDDYPAPFKDEVVLIPGGHTVQGEEKEPLDLNRVREVLQKNKDEIEAYAVCGYFSVRNPDHELRVKRLIQEQTHQPVVCGHEISLQLDAVRRATTTILNAHLIPVIQHLIDSVKRVFRKQSIVAPMMIMKGDGSLMSELAIQDRPIETILSGPAASVIGAKYFLERSGGDQDAVVVDIGGTTTDIALLKGGIPRLNPNGARVGHWQTNVMAIDIRTIGLGGDSQIFFDMDGSLRVGPKRIIPLSYLGYCYPEINEELTRMAEDLGFLPHANYTLFWLSIGREIEDRLSPLAQQVLSQITERPLSLFQLAEVNGHPPSEILKEISTLEKRGLVLQSGVTPTDILHITGTFQDWNRESAERGVKILCKRHNIELPTLIQKLRGVMDRSIGFQILELVLSEYKHSKTELDGCGFCNLFLDQCFRPDAKIEEVEFKLNLKDKIIGIGAPAHAFLLPVAEKLGTKTIVPSYAGVANAVGAITSAIVIRDEAFIKPFQGGFHLHSSQGMTFFSQLEQATDYGRRLLYEITFRKAKEAGAGEVEVWVDEKEHWATSKGGDSVFIEKMITARAMGNPKFFSNGPPKSG
jgi:N-methylhydantoinase A/oxoprolinase/acetone carboxylase beta subunit